MLALRGKATGRGRIKEMDENDAAKVLQIMTSADSGCPSCVRDLFVLFVAEYPDYEVLAKTIFEKEMDCVWKR